VICDLLIFLSYQFEWALVFKARFMGLSFRKLIKQALNKSCHSMEEARKINTKLTV
jgi:hypothetical protein